MNRIELWTRCSHPGLEKRLREFHLRASFPHGPVGFINALRAAYQAEKDLCEWYGNRSGPVIEIRYNGHVLDKQDIKELIDELKILKNRRDRWNRSRAQDRIGQKPESVIDWARETLSRVF